MNLTTMCDKTIDASRKLCADCCQVHGRHATSVDSFPFPSELKGSVATTWFKWCILQRWLWFLLWRNQGNPARDAVKPSLVTKSGPLGTGLWMFQPVFSPLPYTAAGLSLLFLSLWGCCPFWLLKSLSSNPNPIALIRFNLSPASEFSITSLGKVQMQIKHTSAWCVTWYTWFGNQHFCIPLTFTRTT